MSWKKYFKWRETISEKTFKLDWTKEERQLNLKEPLSTCRKALLSYFFIILGQIELEKVIFC